MMPNCKELQNLYIVHFGLYCLIEKSKAPLKTPFDLKWFSLVIWTRGLNRVMNVKNKRKIKPYQNELDKSD